MISCILCLEENFKTKKFELDVAVCGDRKTVKDAIKEQFSYHDQLFAQSSSSQFVCRKCFSSLKDFYNFIDKINAKHILPLSHVKVEEEKDPENFEFADFERPIDMKDLRVVIHRVKTEPEDVSNDNIEWKIEDENSNDKVETSRRYSTDSDFEWKLEEDSEFNIASSLQTELIEIPIPPQNHETELIEIPTKKRKNSSDSEYNPYKGRLVAAKKQASKNKTASKRRNNSEADERINKFFSLKCPLCDHPVDRFFWLTKHFHEVHPGKLPHFVCCYRRFKRRSDLLEHINCHDQKIPYKCEQCKKTYISKSSLRTHIRNIHLNLKVVSNETWMCQDCGKVFKSLFHFKAHQMTHETDPNMSFECYMCKKPYKNLNAVKFHFKNFHNLKRPTNVQCSICSRTVRRLHLSTHMKNKHSNVQKEKVQCNICDHWINKEGLKVHMFKHNDKGINCKVCGKYLFNSQSISSHMKLVHSELNKKFKCTFCDRSYFRELKLQEHIAAAHTREYLYKCRVPGCGKEFRAQGNWKMHEKRAHPEEYEKIFKPFYKRAPDEPKPNIEEALSKLNEIHENNVIEEFYEDVSEIKC